jgi:hypothetical protein
LEGGGWVEGNGEAQRPSGPGEGSVEGNAGPGWGLLNMDGAHHGDQENNVIPYTTRDEARGRRRVGIPTTLTQLSIGLEGSIPDYETSVKDDEDNENSDCNGIKHMFRDETWSQTNFTYDPPCMPFLGRQDNAKFFQNAKYVRHVKSDGTIEGGPKWTDIIMACLKAFIVVHIYMGMKRQPNIKAYWQREGSIFHCPIISNIMTRERFCEIRSCLHITSPATMNILKRVNRIMIKCGKLDG